MSEDGDKAPIVEDAGIDDHEVTTKPKGKAGAKGRTSVGAKKAPAEDIKFEYGDIVLARLRGYPPWPARITAPDDLPANVLAQRPKSSASYCTQFFPAGDFSWLANKDITPLKAHQIEAYIREPHRKSAGALREAYMTAQDPTEWDAHQADKRRALEEADADEDVDELEEEEEGATQGKRKRAPPAPKKETKKAKTTKKADDKPKQPKAAKAEKPKPESEAEPAAPVDDDPMANNKEAVRVKDWRHKLQRAFLSKGLPAASEMDNFDELFKAIETYTEMTVEFLKYSKIDKVMRKIAALTAIPRNDELKITERADKLANDYGSIRRTEEGSKPNGTDGKDTPPAADHAAEPAAAPEAAPANASEPAAKPAVEPTVEPTDETAAEPVPTTTAEPAAASAEDKTEA